MEETMPKKRKNDKNKKQKRSVERAPMLEGIGSSPRGEITPQNALQGYDNIPRGQAILTASRFALDLLGKDQRQSQDLALCDQLGDLSLAYILSEDEQDQEQAEKQAVALLQSELDFTAENAGNTFKTLCDKLQQAYPPEVQAQNSPELFLREDSIHELAPLHFGRFALDKGLHAISEDDIELRGHLEVIDQKIEQGADFSEYGSILNQVEALLEIGLEEWLLNKKLPGKFFFLAGNAAFFGQYIYHKKAEKKLTFKNAGKEEIKDFLYNFLLNHMQAQPHDYATWPAGVKLLYTYLDEIKYCDGASHLQTIEELEGDYVDFLRQKFRPEPQNDLNGFN